MHAEVQDDTLLYQIYSRQFPLDDRRVVVLEDKPPTPKAVRMGVIEILS